MVDLVRWIFLLYIVRSRSLSHIAWARRWNIVQYMTWIPGRQEEWSCFGPQGDGPPFFLLSLVANEDWFRLQSVGNNICL